MLDRDNETCSANSIVPVVSGVVRRTAVGYIRVSTTQLAVGDFNGDTKLDLVVANTGSANVSVLLGNGQGGFAAATNFSVGTSPASVAVGDFNGDMKLDLAVTNTGSANVSVLQGNGQGGFAAAVNYPVGTNPNSLAIGDFNGDLMPDLAITNAASSNVSVLMQTCQ